LQSFVADVSPEQVRAWTESIPPLQSEVAEVLRASAAARHYSAILEYELPMESRRPDVVLLVGAGVMVLELKGKLEPSQADLDQASAYARDLRWYHRECHERPVVPILVPTRARGYVREQSGVHVAGPDALDDLIGRFAGAQDTPSIGRDRFLDEGAYCPQPTLVQAARELMQSGSLRRIERAHACTAPAMDAVTEIIHEAARTRTRHLILLTGLPGSGKTLVGLQTVHAHYLDDLAVARAGMKPTTPAVFLSGNGPLVEVLQYELRAGGGDGKTFVRGVKEYIKRYLGQRSLVPPEHVLVFDEAQRAFDAEMVKRKHPDLPAKSEPELLIDFADRVPEWCVVLGLIGTGQEIHVGEEGGLIQWRNAVEGSSKQWTVHSPPAVARIFADSRVPLDRRNSLSLDRELRFHAAHDLHHFVGRLLGGEDPSGLARTASNLESAGYHLRITRDLEVAKGYLRDRYATNRDARFGMLASSKDRHLVGYGVPNDFQSTKRMRLGAWYGDSEDAYESRSCRTLRECVTEFGAQGLELDGVLLAWGTDLVRRESTWTNKLARGYLRSAHVKDPFQLRINAYRVLLTRGRDGCIVFAPPLQELDETFEFLVAAGYQLVD